jgi:TatA/E family protein of Tat protein translocase
MFGLGMQELLVILIVALLVFGANRLPEIGRSLGRAISEFKKGMQEGESGKSEKKDSAAK